MMMDEEGFGMLGRMMVALEELEGCREFASLIPEVRTNLVYARSRAKTRDDVLAVDGRITVVGGMPRAGGRVRFGASSHMARLIIESRKVDPSIPLGVDFANTPHLAGVGRGLLPGEGMGLLGHRPARRARGDQGGRGSLHALEGGRGGTGGRRKGAKDFYETGAIGKEPVRSSWEGTPLRLSDRSARSLGTTMDPGKPKIGKIDRETFESFMLARLGRKDETVIVPPRTGIDAGVIDLGDGRVLIVAEDPIFAIPGQPYEMFGWYTVHIGASDVAVMGVPPRYMTYTLLMPPETPAPYFCSRRRNGRPLYSFSW